MTSGGADSPPRPQAASRTTTSAAKSSRRIGALRVAYSDPGGDPEQQLEEDAPAQQEVRRRPLPPLEGEARDEVDGEHRQGGGRYHQQLVAGGDVRDLAQWRELEGGLGAQVL